MCSVGFNRFFIDGVRIVSGIEFQLSFRVDVVPQGV